jgi:hypothetical protein
VFAVRLIDLEPRYWGDGKRVLGVSFGCPHCRTVRLGVTFANPPDGGSPGPIVTKTGLPKLIRALMDAGDFEVPPGHLWTRSGDTFESLSLSPSIDASSSGHWHGHITNGAIQ